MRRKPVVAIVMTAATLALAGCNSARLTDSSWLVPKADVGRDDQQTPVNPDDPALPVDQLASDQPAIPSNQTTASTPANIASIAPSSASTISFTPVIGAPVNAVRPLSRQLGSEARARGLMIVNSSDGGSNHILKGYFSAFADGDKTTVAFVWDILDASGTRLHRIRGQEVAQGTAADPWDVVQDATMEAIAARTISEYISWSVQAPSGG